MALTGNAPSRSIAGSHGDAEAALRFDDMLATVLAQPLTTPAARAAAWRQVVDLLGQRRAIGEDPIRDEAYDLLRQVRSEVPETVRAEAARALAGHRIPPELVALFAEETPAIMSPLIAGARLPDDDWLELLPALPPLARGLLRNRRDLSAAVMRGLASFGATDFALRAPSGTGAGELPADAAYAELELIDAAPPPMEAAPEPPEAAAEAAEPAVSTTADGTPAEAALATAAEAGPAAAEPMLERAPLDGEAQIRDLMARIDAFRRAAPAPADGFAEHDSVPAQSDDFRFETGPEGIILWVEGAPRGPLIGVTIAAAADRFDHGVDGHAAGAYRQRAPFRDARLSVAGVGPAAGEWRISAVPFFDPHDGRFTGYRGTARRPRADETAVASSAPAGLYGTGLPPDSLRQLVHELRTPLNAIVGFAEMIERQLLGPAASEYRGRAADIIAQGRRLLATVDDLDVSARIESQRIALDPAPVDAALLLARLQADYERLAAERGVLLDVAIAEPLPLVDADPVAVERMFARLLAAAAGLAGKNERIAIRLGAGGEGEDARVGLTISRPRLLAGRDERALLDPGYSPDGDWPDAPVLGLGFALRLVRNLAQAAHGRLEIEAGSFILRLPARANGVLSGNRCL